MRINPKDNPKLIALIKACGNFLITCKLLIFKWIYDATFWLACYNEEICKLIVKAFMGAGWVYRDGTKYLYLTQFHVNFESYRYQLALLMIVHRILFGALRYSYLMQFINRVRSSVDDPVIFEFQLDDYSDLSFAKIITKITGQNVDFEFVPTGTQKKAFKCTYQIEFNVLTFPAEFDEPVPVEPPKMDINEIESLANSWKILDKNQNDEETVTNHDDPELRQRIVEPDA